ncbi:MAG: hypothetical protein EPN57_04560 [Paraburkholderia sp.]|nr:MAG: hypothetical protein EPN57_04560 [Paraburkholderia sp.]
MKIKGFVFSKAKFAAVVSIAAYLIAPIASLAADNASPPTQHRAGSHQAKTSEPDYVKFNVEFDNKSTVPLLFQLQAQRCMTGNFPHVVTVKPGDPPYSFTMKTLNVNRCLNVNKYLMWDVTPQVGASTAPYRLKFIHGQNGNWGTTINVDGDIPPSGAVRSATCNGKDCLNQWFYESTETFLVIGFQ